MPARERCISVWFHRGHVPRWTACLGLLPQPVACIPAETNRVVQVKYTNQNASSQDDAGKYAFDRKKKPSVSFLSLGCGGASKRPQVAGGGRTLSSLSFSGSNQARKGRLVNALAVRGDEGRDTLR